MPERFRAKWIPVRVKKTRQNKNLEPRSDSLGTEKALEHFQAKWTPVRVKKTRQNKNLEPRFDSIKTEKALDPGLRQHRMRREV